MSSVFLPFEPLILTFVPHVDSLAAERKQKSFVESYEEIEILQYPVDSLKCESLQSPSLLLLNNIPIICYQLQWLDYNGFTSCTIVYTDEEDELTEAIPKMVRSWVEHRNQVKPHMPWDEPTFLMVPSRTSTVVSSTPLMDVSSKPAIRKPYLREVLDAWVEFDGFKQHRDILLIESTSIANISLVDFANKILGTGATIYSVMSTDFRRVGSVKSRTTFRNDMHSPLVRLCLINEESDEILDFRSTRDLMPDEDDLQTDPDFFVVQSGLLQKNPRSVLRYDLSFVGIHYININTLYMQRPTEAAPLLSPIKNPREKSDAVNAAASQAMIWESLHSCEVAQATRPGPILTKNTPTPLSGMEVLMRNCIDLHMCHGLKQRFPPRGEEKKEDGYLGVVRMPTSGVYAYIVDQPDPRTRKKFTPSIMSESQAPKKNKAPPKKAKKAKKGKKGKKKGGSGPQDYMYVTKLNVVQDYLHACEDIYPRGSALTEFLTKTRLSTFESTPKFDFVEQGIEVLKHNYASEDGGTNIDAVLEFYKIDGDELQKGEEDGLRNRFVALEPTTVKGSILLGDNAIFDRYNSTDVNMLQEVVIENSTIGRNFRCGRNVYVYNSIIMDNVRVRDDSSIINSIIMPGCGPNIGEEAVIGVHYKEAGQRIDDSTKNVTLDRCAVYSCTQRGNYRNLRRFLDATS
ncbi:hypothetical protein PCE1_001972 [Barthelona sp. PCE]